MNNLPQYLSCCSTSINRALLLCFFFFFFCHFPSNLLFKKKTSPNVWTHWPWELIHTLSLTHTHTQLMADAITLPEFSICNDTCVMRDNSIVSLASNTRWHATMYTPSSPRGTNKVNTCCACVCQPASRCVHTVRYYYYTCKLIVYACWFIIPL